jgi:hypothetical protein
MPRAFVFALVFSGCVRTTYLTDWFRVSKKDAEWTIMAESGGPKPAYKSERLSNGKWVELSNYSEARAIDDGKRVVYIGPSERQNRLMTITKDSAPEPFACDGMLFAKRDKQLLCIVYEPAESGLSTSIPIEVMRLSAAGEPQGAAEHFELPGNPNKGWSERHVVGLLNDRPVVVVETGRMSSTETFPGDDCALYMLEQPPQTVGKPMLVGKHPPYQRARFEHCVEPEVIDLMRGAITLEPLAGLDGYP